MPVAILLLGLNKLALNIHIRHAKDGCHKQHRQIDAKDGHAVLLPVCLCVERNKFKIISHLCTMLLSRLYFSD